MQMRLGVHTDVCPHCGRVFPISGNRKIEVMPLDSPFGGLVIGLKELRIFDVLVCPQCNGEFTSHKVKMFGVFPRAQLWIPFAIVVAAFAFMVWQVNNP
jgi:uncharacterized protein YbaR (Trm112 family)